MLSPLPLPRLIFGPGSLSVLAEELALLGVRRPLLISDNGLERAGIAARAAKAMPQSTAQFLAVPENPTIEAADAAAAQYRAAGCDGVLALGGGSVLDTGKFVAALSGSDGATAADLLGRPDRIATVCPLIAVPTTIGTGSESSPAAGLHADERTAAVGTRSPKLVPRVAICDPDLARTLPPRLIAATGVDALSHCIEGFFAEPPHPLADAFAIEGIRLAYAAVGKATEPDGDVARCELMAAAFAGGVAIHKGLGPAHAIAIVCGDQGIHHGALVAAALPLTLGLVAPRAPEKAARAMEALGVDDVGEMSAALYALNRALNLPLTLSQAGYKAQSIDDLADGMVRSHFNKTSPYMPTLDEYRDILRRLLD